MIDRQIMADHEAYADFGERDPDQWKLVEQETDRLVESLGKKLYPSRRTLGGSGSGNFGHGGRPGEVGGSSSDGGSADSSRAADLEQVGTLKAQWSRLNDELFDYVDTDPNHPRAQELVRQQIDVMKQMHRLDADPGGHAGIGLPGGPRDVVIIGSGPGGMASAITAGADGLDTLIVESRDSAGGQSKFSSRVENYPGFPIGVSGNKLAADMQTQVARMGAEQKFGVSVTGMSYDPVTDLKTVTLSDGTRVEARTVVIAGGVEFKKAEFPVDNEKNVVYGDSSIVAHMGAGKEVLIAGGSNGAAQAALLAAKTAEHTTLVSRKPIEISMSDYQVSALRNHPKITVIEGVEIQGIRNGKATLNNGRTVGADATGIFFGGRSKTGFLPSEVKREAKTQKIITDHNLETEVPGVFAVGDMRHKGIARIGSSVGDGQMATAGIFQYFERVKRIGHVFGKRK